MHNTLYVSIYPGQTDPMPLRWPEVTFAKETAYYTTGQKDKISLCVLLVLFFMLLEDIDPERRLIIIHFLGKVMIPMEINGFCPVYLGWTTT